VTIARHYFIGGRVQGVGFRYYVHEAARQEDVRGWVRNVHDGRVEAFAEGDPEAVARFEARLRQGPSLSRIGHVDIEETTPAGAAGFEIRPSAL
jgi:acylphosphatase